MEVEEGTYRFVAYSFNSSSESPGVAETVAGVAPQSQDLLWGMSSATVVDDAYESVSLTVRHKFSKLTVVVTTADMNVGQSGVEIADYMVGFTSYTADLTVASGALSAAGLSAVGGPSVGVSPAVSHSLSLGRVFTAGASPTTVGLDVTLDGGVYGGSAELTGLSASFAMALEEGKEYLLTIRLKQVSFAGSNVYWVETRAATPSEPGGGYLTFDPAGQNGNGMLQGVLFRWGSLVGVSPALTNGYTAFDFGVAGDATTGTPIYVPDETEASGYIQTNGATMGWTTSYGSPGDTPAMLPAPTTDIPHFDKSFAQAAGEQGRGISFASDPEQNTQAVWDGYRGDICRHIGAKSAAGPAGYRLPNGYEVGMGTSAVNYDANGETTVGWYRVPAGDNTSFTQDSSLGNPLGTAVLTNGAYTYQGVFFPASGCRRSGQYNGVLEDVHHTGHYWSNATYGYGYAYDLRVLGSTVYLFSAASSSFYYSVRCVKE
jgi:hypothetical protein